jgi:hypothetical protein
VTQSDSVRLPRGEVVTRRVTLDCYLVDVDRSRRIPDAEPAIIRDFLACDPRSEEGVMEARYGAYTIGVIGSF